MDENGDAEGNYTLIARKKLWQTNETFGLFPVGVFTLRSNNSKLPVSYHCYYYTSIFNCVIRPFSFLIVVYYSTW